VNTVESFIQPASAVVPGGAGLPDPGLCAQLAAATLVNAAGPELRLVSLVLEIGPMLPISGADMSMALRADKRSRSVAFLRLTVEDGERLVFSARAVFASSPG
jgi:hypothetical protein